MSMTRDRMEEILNETTKYKIELAHDPTALGPKYLQDLIATCRNYTNHVARLLNEVGRARMAVDFELRRRQTAFQISADELLANNPMVRNLPNIADRQAQINLLLKDEHRGIKDLENDLKDLDHVQKLVRDQHRELKDTMNEIKTQRSLIRDDLDTGRMYGDERNTPTGNPYKQGAAGVPDDMDPDEIDAILRGEKPLPKSDDEPDTVSESQVEAQNPSDDTQSESVQTATEPAPAPVQEAPAVTREEAQVLAFLEGSKATQKSVSAPSVPPVAASSVVSSDDFTDIFNSL